VNVVIGELFIEIVGSALYDRAKGTLGEVFTGTAGQKAVEATANDFPEISVVRDALTRWCKSEEFVAQLEAIQSGRDGDADEALVESFVEVGLFHDGLHNTHERARHVLETFAQHLRRELYRSEGGLFIESSRADLRHQETKEKLAALSEEMHAGFERSHYTDVEKLRRHSASTLQALSDFSTIRVGERIIKIDRPSSAALREVAEEQSVVVVGEPGAGKSGVLYDLVDTYISENRDVVLLAVDKLEARSLGELRLELGLEHEFIDVLNNWPGEGPALLVVDALDAARSEASAQTFYDLVAGLPVRWRVVASIRQFDLRHNVKLRKLFAGRPPSEFQSPEFYNLRHLNVPRLDVEEWKQIARQSPELAELVIKAGDRMRELLRVPFNVMLAGELLSGGLSVDELSPIETQIGLLDRYWRERVIRQDREGDAREALLLRAVEAMVRTRSLRANRREVANDPAHSRPLDDLLSSHILSEWEPEPGAPADRSVLTVAHHMLFDYAVACLLLRGTPQSFVARLEQEPETVMSIRPSIVMHFEHEWLRNKDLFWDAVFRVIRSEQIPEIGKIIGPTAAVESAKSIDGFAPMVQALSSADVKRREIAEKALRHVTGALLVGATASPGSLSGPSAPAWAELMDQCTTEMRAATAYSVRPMLHALCDRPESLAEEQMRFAGRVARRLLGFALDQEERNSLLVISGIQVVCRTFGSDPEASAAVLRRCIEPRHVLQFGHEEIFRIANELERLIPLDPSLVEDIYQAAFTLNDDSQDKTEMGGSRIMPLSSTRRQDFGMGRYALAGKYKEFLKGSPLHATRALIAALGAYVEERHNQRPGRAFVEESVEEESFEFDGREAVIRTDHSEIWDKGIAHQDDKPLRMLDAFQSYIEQINMDEGKADERRQILDLIVEENRAAVLWRRLLKIGAKFPLTLGHDLRSLGWSMPILLSFDTSRVAGDFLKALFGRMTPQERERVERSILSLPEAAGEGWWGNPEYARNRLLGCLSRESLVTTEAKTVLSELDAEKKVPANEPVFKTSGVISRPYTDEDYLRGQGVAVEDEQNRRIRALSAPAKEFATRHQNTAPTRREVDEVLPPLRTLYTALQTAEADGVHEGERDLAWGYLADACQAVAECEEISCETDVGSFIRAVLVEAAAYPQPTHNPENDEHFDKLQSWGSPAARIEAAGGIIRLARHGSCTDSALLETIECLSRDEMPAVRYQVAGRLTSLYETAPELMWTLTERISQEEKSRGVLQGLLHGTLQPLAGHHPDRVTDCVRFIFERVRDGAGADEVRNGCASIFLGLHLWQNHPVCAQILDTIAADPAGYSVEAHQIALDVRKWLNVGPVETPERLKDAARLGSFKLLERILESTREGIRALEAKYSTTPSLPWSSEDQEAGSSLARLADSIGMQIYFASGAYRDAPQDDEDEKVPIGIAERSRFLRESRRCLELLSDFGFASLTHHLLETLEYLLPLDPERVFLLVGRVVRAGKRGGYHYESMAVDLIVRLVERFIAEFRHILQENEECRRMLVEILDTFVEVGWPSARRLTYRLEDIFR
jgi:hypothetical protein